jgi:hypothetical protein
LSTVAACTPATNRRYTARFPGGTYTRTLCCHWGWASWGSTTRARFSSFVSFVSYDMTMI